MEYVWVRHELLNNPDNANVHERLREGYEPVTPDELGDDYHADVMSAGKHAGTVRSGDLILMKNSKELVAQKKRTTKLKAERWVMLTVQNICNSKIQICQYQMNLLLRQQEVGESKTKI